MKLKMYFIGLGMGVIVTAVIMGIALSGRTREMSDEEIIARARQLGMTEAGTLTEAPSNGQNTLLVAQNQTVTPTDTQTPVTSAQDTVDPSSLVITGEEDDADEADEADSADASEARAGTQNAGQSDAAGARTENTAQSENSADTPSRTDAGTSAQTGASAGNQSTAGSTQESVSTASATTQEQVTGSIVVTIPDASSSEEICELLETAGVIDNATAFNNFLIQNGRDRYISTGAKLIPRGSSYEDVSRIITGR